MFIGYPKVKAAHVALKTVKTWLEENDDWVCNKIAISQKTEGLFNFSPNNRKT
jgi:exoribonuclease II